MKQGAILGILGVGSACLVGGCGGRIAQGGPDDSSPLPAATATTSASPNVPAAPTTKPTSCASDAPFITITTVSGISQPSVPDGSYVDDATPRLTPDELTIYFSRSVLGSTNATEVVVAQRAARTAPFGAPTAVHLLNTWGAGDFDANPWAPSISSDGLHLFYADSGAKQVMEASRSSGVSDFSPGSNAFPLPSSESPAGYPFITADGAELWFVASIKGATTIFRAQTNPTGNGFINGAEITELNIAQVSSVPVLSADRLTIYISAWFNGMPNYDADIYVAHRTSVSAPFSKPIALAQVNTPFVEMPGWLSPDNCRFYFSQSKSADPAQVLYVAERASQK